MFAVFIYFRFSPLLTAPFVFIECHRVVFCCRTNITFKLLRGCIKNQGIEVQSTTPLLHLC